MTEYHIVYETMPRLGGFQHSETGEEVTSTYESFIERMNYLKNRNESILGVYLTGSEFDQYQAVNKTRKLTKFRSHLDNLEHRL